MTLVEKYALLPEEIDRQSLVMVADSLRDDTDAASLPEAERYVLHRIVRAEGDPQIAADVRFSDGAVDAALASLREVRRVVTDVRMVQVGISRAALARRGVETACLIDAPEVAERARREGTTRSVAAVRELAPQMEWGSAGNRQRADRAAGPVGPGRRRPGVSGCCHRDAGGFCSLP